MISNQKTVGRIAILSISALVALVVTSGRADELQFEGLGKYSRKISTKSPKAQQLFDQGLAFLHGFNHEEAQRSFQAAAKQDPNCSMIYCAMAMTNGPHINFPFVDETHSASAIEALKQARKSIERASPVERDLLSALEKRYTSPPPEDRRPLDEAFAKAMRDLWRKYPQDTDVGAWFAESMMDLWPWDLWTADGQPKQDTQEIVKTLETVLALQPDHPLALHLYIHAMEASPFPERSALAAHRLRDLQPGSGHLVHMPSHIDVRLGHWQRAIEANELAIKADATYRAKSPDQNFFRIYMAHNHHMLAFAAMMQGQDQRSTDAIHQMLKEIPEAWLEKNAMFVDGMFAMPYEMHLRFGRWDAMLAEPAARADMPIAQTYRRFARGVAYAAKKQVAEARIEQQAFRDAAKALPEQARFVMNSAADVFAVADAMLDGEILYRLGQVDPAFAKFHEAVALEENLRYIEPPDWIQPVRHVLGATLIDAKRYKEAENVYRKDLVRHPDNGWSLFGLSKCLKAQGRMDEADTVLAAFERAWKHADVKLTSSCFCFSGGQ